MSVARLLLLVSLLVSAAGCSLGLVGARESKNYFVLNDPALKHLEPRPLPFTKHLYIRPTDGSRFLNSKKIVFSTRPEQRGYYRLSFWTDPPPVQITQLLQLRMEKVKLFDKVSTSSSALGDLQLNTELLEFYHDTASMPGFVRVKLRAELVETASHELLGSTVIEHAADSESYDIEGAVEAFEVASGRVLDDIVRWLEKVLVAEE